MPAKNRGSSLQSFITFKNSQGHEASGTIIHLTRNQVAFEVYNPYSVVQMSEVLTDFHIWQGERSIYSGKVVVNHMVGTGVMIVVSAALVDELNITALKPGPELRGEVENFVQDWTKTHNHLVPEYHLIVSSIRSYMRELSQWTERAETAAGVHDQRSDSLAQEFLEDVADKALPKCNELFTEFEVQAARVPDEDVDYHKAYARKELHPLIMVSPFIHRTFTKPLGYAGDYEMVNMILRDPWEGQNTYAKLVNSIVLLSNGAQAHRNRIEWLVDRLTEETIRIKQADRRLRVLNVGCGPSGELVRFIQQSALSDRLDIELMDFNDETLAYAESQVSTAVKQHGRSCQIKYVHLSINDLLRAAARDDRQLPLSLEYDLVYCAGLFDYILDRGCSRLLRLFYNWVIPDGLVLSTNVHPRNSVKGFLEHLQEWYLYLRDEKDMLKLAGDNGHLKVETDATGNNVFLHMRKPK